MKSFEPQRGQDLVVSSYTTLQHHAFFLFLVPKLSDIFVFSYPLVLVGMYCWGIYKNPSYKPHAIFVFFSTFLSSLTTIGIQFFIDKQRPIAFFGWLQESPKTILHQFLPTSSFPSDHATVSMAVTVSFLILYYKTKNKLYIIVFFIMLSFALIMGGARVMTGLHRPTDIIAGWCVGSIIPLLLSHPKLYHIVINYIATPLIQIEESIMSSIKNLWKKTCKKKK